jgi:hypothetical protein
VGHVASVWLQEGSKDTAAAIQTNTPRPDGSGVITAISENGKVLTLESKGRAGEVIKSDINLTDQTRIEVVGADRVEDKKLKVGYGVTIWLQEGSRDTAATVQALTPEQLLIQRKSPDVAGTITAISIDFKVITLETRKRGEDQTIKTDIKLGDKTRILFAGTEKDDEKVLKVGYTASVWLQEGSTDTAAVVRAVKPAERRR